MLGDYSAPEAKVLKTATEATQREIVETTDDAALQDLWKEHGAQADVGALLQKLTTGFPPGCDADDYTVRTVLSEDLQTIVNYAAICSFSGMAGNVRGRVEKIVAEAIRDGMPSNVANTRLAAFLAGLDEGRPRKPSGIWSKLKGTVRR